MSETPTPTPSRLVRWLPTLLGLACAGVGLGAAGFAANDLELRVPAAPSPGPDPLALLRDDVATLQGDVRSLGKTNQTNFQTLAEGLDGAAEERHRAQEKRLRALSARIAALESAQSAQAKTAAAERGRILARLDAPGGGALASAGDSTPSPAATPEPAQPDPPQTDPAQPEVEPTPGSKAQPEPEPERKKRGLFSFKLAGGGLDFTQRQRYEVIGSLSRVGFDAKSTLHDFTGATKEVSGWFSARLDQSDPKARGTIEAAVSGLRTGVDGRDEELRKVMAADQHPQIEFQLERLEIQKSDPEARTAEGIAHGRFTIHGVEHEAAVALKLSVDASRRLIAEGEAPLEMSSYKVEVPSVAGAINVEDQVKIWLSLRLRAMGPAEGGKE